MYLEISARRSGKTTRMINRINKEMQEGRHAVIVTPTMQFRNFIEPQLTKCNNYTFCTVDNQADKLFELGLNTKRRPIREFYDEFDMVNYVPVSLTGYYCTTPVKSRDSAHMLEFKRRKVKDPMLSLIEANGGYYLNYTMLGDQEQVYTYVPKDRWAHELYGTIVNNSRADQPNFK